MKIIPYQKLYSMTSATCGAGAATLPEHMSSSPDLSGVRVA